MAWYRCGGTPSNILALPTPSEASGAIARFNTDLTENLLSAVAEFSATQAEGTPTPAAPIPIVGVDKVNVTRTGKNLLFFVDTTQTNTLNGVTYDFNANTQEITLSGSNTKSDAAYILKSFTPEFFKLSVGDTCKVSLTSELPSGCYLNITYINTSGTISAFQLTKTDNVYTFTVPNNYASFKHFQIGVYKTATAISNTTLKIQLELGSTATDYEPYNGTTALINLGGTYYGGSVDAVTGKITKTVDIINDLSIRTWHATSTPHIFYATINEKKAGYTSFLMCEQYSKYEEYFTGLGNNQISSNITYPYIYIRNDACDTPSDLVAALSGVKLAYELATPIEVQASNTAEIPTIVGDNQVFADTGDVAVKYFETVGHKI